MKKEIIETTLKAEESNALKKAWSSPEIIIIGKNNIEKPVVNASEFHSSSGPVS